MFIIYQRLIASITNENQKNGRNTGDDSDDEDYDDQEFGQGVPQQCAQQ